MDAQNMRNDLDVMEGEIAKAEKQLQEMKAVYEAKKRMLCKTCTHQKYKVVSNWNFRDKGVLFVCETCKLIFKTRPRGMEVHAIQH